MKYVVLVLRVLLGLAFLAFGSNMLHPWMPQPSMSGEPAAYMAVMFGTHAIWVVGFFQALSGLLLLVGRYVPLALTILSAIIVNIWAYHLFIAHSDYGMPLVVTLLVAVLIWAYRGSFAGIFNASAQPSV